MTIMALLGAGAMLGLLAGLVFTRPSVGCVSLMLIPVGMIVYIYLWQSAHSPNLRSTSSLDYLFGPFWPSIGALAGFFVGMAIRERRNGD